MTDRDGYPHGVPCWIDTAQPDPDAAAAFYGGLFGWESEDRLPPGAPGRYLVARKDGQTVAAITSPDPTTPATPAWDMSIWADDADAAAAAVAAAGGTVLVGPEDVGPPGGPRAGRFATCTDPQGARFLLWQARTNRGAERVDADGSWNFSELATGDPAGAAAFYGRVFGWVVDEPDEAGGASLVRLPGYGDFLEQREPDLRKRQAESGVPAGFENAVAWVQPLGAERALTRPPTAPARTCCTRGPPRSSGAAGPPAPAPAPAGQPYISDPGVVSRSPVSSQVLRPDSTIGHPPCSSSGAPSRSSWVTRSRQESPTGSISQVTRPGPSARTSSLHRAVIVCTRRRGGSTSRFSPSYSGPGAPGLPIS